MNENLVKYLAGLLDADGSLSFKFRRDDNKDDRYFPSLMLSLHSSAAVDRGGFVQKLPITTGIGVFSTYGDKRQFYRWDIAKRADLEMLLPRLVKHMVVKAQHWLWMLELWREKRGTGCNKVEREEIVAAVKRSRILRSGPLHPKNHPTWAWVAGFLDGDGCYHHFYFERNRCWVSRVGAVSHKNDAHVLTFLQKAFGGYVREHGQTESCLIWDRNLGPRERSFALMFLSKIARHARLKRHKIDQIIHNHQQRLSAPSPTG